MGLLHIAVILLNIYRENQVIPNVISSIRSLSKLYLAGLKRRNLSNVIINEQVFYGKTLYELKKEDKLGSLILIRLI